MSGSSFEDQLNKPGVLIIDARQPEEVALSHDFICARNVPVKDIANKLEEFGIEKSRPIVLYYGSGTKTHHAERVLRDAGFTDVAATVNQKALEVHTQKWRVLS